MSLKPYLISHLLENSASLCPDKIAIKHKARTITFGQLYQESLKMKGLLLGSGIKKGERVGILLDKSIEQLVSMFGISMAGAVFVFINSILKQKQIDHIINDCQVKFLITTSSHHKKNDLSLSVNILYMDEGTNEAGFPCWQKVKHHLQADQTSVYQIADDIACLIYTSGSTGLPKGVVVPHRTLVEGAEIVSTYLNITENDSLISVLPFNFDYGLNQATTSILKGATLVMHQFLLPKDLLKVLEEEKITGFAGMTPIWAKLFNDKYAIKLDYDFPHLRYITNTGGKVPRSIVAKMRTFFPNTKIFLMYGLTEAFRSTYLPPEEVDRRPDSIGKGIPNVEIIVLNERGEECVPGEPGELIHRGALITKGYWNDPGKTREVFRKNPLLKDQDHLNEIVVYSGDLVKKDEQGFVYFISRKDEMIKTSGYRVSPTEVEEALVEIPGVSNAVVFGKEVESGEQIVVAVIETNSLGTDKKIILQECKGRLPQYMVPHEIHCEKAFKKTANGKIDRSLIKQRWMISEEQDGA
jgi:acyl-CoA ligase (AMP-forming) (exosortase A-associated)